MNNVRKSYLLNICTLLMVHTWTMGGLRDLPIFFKTFIKDPSSVGALFPCSKSVGTEITKYLSEFMRANPKASVRVLEVGAGTGSLTESILNILRPCDHLDAIEISSEFCQVLHNKFDSNPCVSIQCMSILDWKPDYQYDFIICTLPFNSLDADLVSAILDHLKDLSKSNGILSYVAYTGVSTIKAPFLWGKRKKEHRKKMRTIEAFCDEYLMEKKMILKNAPPINIYHCRIVH